MYRNIQMEVNLIPKPNQTRDISYQPHDRIGDINLITHMCQLSGSTYRTTAPSSAALYYRRNNQYDNSVPEDHPLQFPGNNVLVLIIKLLADTWANASISEQDGPVKFDRETN